MRRAARVDANQPEVTEKLRGLGFDVALTHQLGNGFVDMVVGFDRLNIMVELKPDEKAKLTKAEFAFHNSWQGQIGKCVTVNNILDEFLVYYDFHDRYNCKRIADELRRMKSG